MWKTIIWHEPLNGLINQITPMTRTLICYPTFLLSHDVTFSFCLTKAETVFVLTAWLNCKYSNLMLISILLSRLYMSASNVMYRWNALSLNFQFDIDYKLNKCIIFERQILNECLFKEMKEAESIDINCIHVHVYLDSIDIRII